MIANYLSENDRSDFIRNGYIVKRGVLNDEACRRCIAVAWRELAKKSIRQEPRSWKPDPYLRPRKGVVKLRDEVAGDPELRALITENSVLKNVAASLIGESMTNLGVRGLYPTFPIPVYNARPYEPHVEMHPVQIFVMVYLDHVSDRNGAMCVWPGTHTDVYQDFDSKFEFRPRPAFQRKYQQFNYLAPIELTGGPGDAFFCHHRVLHSGSNNLREKIRFGVLVDFLRSDIDALAASEPGPDMWEYWSTGLRASAASASRLRADPLAYSLSRSLMLRVLGAARRLRGKPAYAYEP